MFLQRGGEKLAVFDVGTRVHELFQLCDVAAVTPLRCYLGDRLREFVEASDAVLGWSTGAAFQAHRCRDFSLFLYDSFFNIVTILVKNLLLVHGNDVKQYIYHLLRVRIK
jgi:hypothetical protein